MIDIDEWTITQAVLKAQAGTQDARLRRVLDALVRHLHDCARGLSLSGLASCMAAVQAKSPCAAT
ncbi:hypothetical protein C8234_14085, partial [Paracidovorax avenae]